MDAYCGGVEGGKQSVKRYNGVSKLSKVQQISLLGEENTGVAGE